MAATARRKPPKSTSRGGSAHSGGGRRPIHVFEQMVDDVAHLMAHRATAEMISVALGAKHGKPAPGGGRLPVPIETVRDYMARVRQRWANDPHRQESRDDAVQRALQRLYRRLAVLKGAGNNREAVELEKLIAKIEGTEANAKVDVNLPGAGGANGPAALQSLPAVLQAFKNLVGEKD